MRKRLLDLPELLAQVGCYLHPIDLFACILVSHTFHQAFIPYLWHTIDDSTEAWVSILQDPTNLSRAYLASCPPKDPTKDRDWLFATFKKHGQFIRHLRVQFLVVLQAVSAGGTCTGLKRLVVTLGRWVEGAPRLVYEPRPGLAPVFGGFGVAPAAAGFGVFGVNEPVPPEPVIELSGPMFPDLLTEADIIPKPYDNNTTDSRKAVAEYEWVLTQHLWHLVRSNPGLEQFDTHSRFSIGFVPVSVDFSCATLRSLRNLKVLDGRYRFENVEFWKLWSYLPAGIESLAVDCSVFPLPNPLPEVNNSSLRILNARGKMPVLGSRESTTLNGLLTLLGMFPNLVRLTVGQVRPNPNSSLDPDFIPLPPTPLGGKFLKRLEAIVEDWETILRYIPSIAEWASESMPDMILLAERFPGLESFESFHDVSEYLPAESDPANRFLSTSCNLRKFDSIKNCIRVDEMLRLPWTCMGLEWLTCRIVGVDRLNEEEEAVVARVMVPGYSAELTEEETRAVEKFHRCRAQHHGVYNRLASLMRLKHLDLGYENRNPWEYKGGVSYIGNDGEEYLEYCKPAFDTLELTLESGLDRLAALKELEMFGFECLNHRIGKAELDWMAKSWPKMTLMYGLDKERLMDIEYDKKRIELRKYFKRLRPEVVHDSLFEDDY
ncbi:hypothetical protein BGZ89_008983 [Linnemannia elongata]|nr:hypothetical protein BGZ89_008983 [Linnemannia elongata]